MNEFIMENIKKWNELLTKFVSLFERLVIAIEGLYQEKDNESRYRWMDGEQVMKELEEEEQMKCPKCGIMEICYNPNASIYYCPSGNDCEWEIYVPTELKNHFIREFLKLHAYPEDRGASRLCDICLIDAPMGRTDLKDGTKLDLCKECLKTIRFLEWNAIRIRQQLEKKES